MALADVDLERSFLDEFRERIGIGEPGLAIDDPGVMFRVKGRDRWVSPRLVSFAPAERSVRGAYDAVTWSITCCLKVEAKGERRLVLSEIVDVVRRAVDPRYAAKAMVIKQEDGTAVGILQFSPPAEARSYNQSVRVRGDSIPGVDFATLTVPCRLDASGCGRGG